MFRPYGRISKRPAMLIWQAFSVKRKHASGADNRTVMRCSKDHASMLNRRGVAGAGRFCGSVVKESRERSGDLLITFLGSRS